MPAIDVEADSRRGWRPFEYEAAARDGTRLAGRLFARDELALDRELERRGLVLTRARALTPDSQARHGRLRHQELVAFTTQLSTLLQAGLPLVQALRLVGQRVRSRRSRAVVEEVLRDIEGGRSFGEALGAQPQSFPTVYRAAVEAGEHSMELPAVLRRQARSLQWVRAVRVQVVQALIYPSVLALALLGLATILLTFLLPRLVQLMPGGVEALPAETQFVLRLSEFLRGQWPWLAAGALALVGGFTALRLDPRGRVALSRTALHLPRVGSLLRMVATARFASTASLLHNAGCEAVRTFDLAARSCGNAALEHSLLRAAESVRQGQPLTVSLEREAEVDPFLVQLVAVGESSGELGHCLEQVAEAYDEEVPRQVKWALALIEPLILIVGGLVVAFLLAATILPIFSVYESLG